MPFNKQIDNMKKIIIAPKGYTLEVESWENDGDSYETNKIVVQTKEEVEKLVKICKELFISCNNEDGGIGNTDEDDENEADETIAEYIEENPELDFTVAQIKKLSYKLCGKSDYYAFRVFSSLKVLYTPIDITIEDVTKQF